MMASGFEWKWEKRIEELEALLSAANGVILQAQSENERLKAQFASSTPMEAYSEEIDRLRAALAEKDAAMDKAQELTRDYGHTFLSRSEWWIGARRAGHD